MEYSPGWNVGMFCGAQWVTSNEQSAESNSLPTYYCSSVCVGFGYVKLFMTNGKREHFPFSINKFNYNEFHRCYRQRRQKQKHSFDSMDLCRHIRNGIESVTRLWVTRQLMARYHALNWWTVELLVSNGLFKCVLNSSSQRQREQRVATLPLPTISEAVGDTSEHKDHILFTPNSSMTFK